MTKYEAMLMLLPDMGEKKLAETLSELKKLLESYDAKISNEEIWGNRDLAYRIRKQDRGYYVIWHFDMPGPNLSELERNLNIYPELMRYLIIKTPVNYEYVTLAEYEKISAEAEKEAQKEKKQAERPMPAPRRAAPAPAPKAKEEAPKEKKAPAKSLSADEKKAAEAKLSSLVDDPDISL